MVKNPRLCLEDIARSIRWIEADIKHLEFDAFRRSRTIMQAVERNIEIISEASRKIPGDMKAKHPEIAWQALAGIGNILRHDYDEIVPSIIWKAITHDLKPLKLAVRKLLDGLE